MHDSAYKDCQRFVNRWLPPTNLVIAEIGSQDVNGSVRDLFNRPGWTYTGYDIVPGKGVDVVLKRPLSWDEINYRSVDVMVATQVLEHIRQPWWFLGEARCRLRIGGILYICSPNTHPYHEYPVDCFRFYPEGLIALAELCELATLECYFNEPSSSYGPVGDTTLVARRMYQ